MVFLSPPNSNGLALSTCQARTNPPLTRALAASWGHGDEATAMAARAAYNGINWPVFENAAKKSEHHSFYTDRPGGRAPSRYPMRNSMFTFYNINNDL